MLTTLIECRINGFSVDFVYEDEEGFEEREIFIFASFSDMVLEMAKQFDIKTAEVEKVLKLVKGKKDANPSDDS